MVYMKRKSMVCIFSVKRKQLFFMNKITILPKDIFSILYAAKLSSRQRARFAFKSFVLRTKNGQFFHGWWIYLILLLRENYPRLQQKHEYSIFGRNDCNFVRLLIFYYFKSGMWFHSAQPRLTSKSAQKLSSLYSFHVYKSERKNSLSTF